VAEVLLKMIAGVKARGKAVALKCAKSRLLHKNSGFFRHQKDWKTPYCARKANLTLYLKKEDC